MTEPRWDDERLRQAYRDRFGGPASPDLVRAVIDDLPTRDRPADRRVLALAAVVAIVATTVGVGIVLSPGPFLMPPRPDNTSTPTLTTPNPQTATPEPTPTRGSAVSFPREVHGLAVISVTEALAQLQTARQSLDRDDTELAVRGFYIVPPDSVACQLPRDDIEPLPPIDRSCPDGLVWLLEDQERPWDLVDGVAEWHRPIRPALYPIVGPNVPFELPQLFRDTSEAEPLAVIVVGHFFDASARTDREAEQFIVDALVWHSGEPSGDQTVITGARPTEERAVVEARVEAALGPARATWAAVIDGSALIGLDSSPSEELLAADAVWQLSRLVEEFALPVVRIAYTVDGGTRIWGPGGLAPERRVDIGATADGTVVDMIDVPDVVIAARKVAAEEPDQASPRVFTVGVVVPVAISNPPGRPNELRLRWIGTDCDERWTILLAGDGRSMDLIPTRRTVCRAVGVEVDIVLTFSGPVPADDVMIGGFGAGG